MPINGAACNKDNVGDTTFTEETTNCRVDADSSNELWYGMLDLCLGCSKKHAKYKITFVCTEVYNYIIQQDQYRWYIDSATMLEGCH